MTDVVAMRDGIGGEIGEQRPALGIDLGKGGQRLRFVGQRLVVLLEHGFEYGPEVVDGCQLQIRGTGGLDLPLPCSETDDLTQPVIAAHALDAFRDRALDQQDAYRRGEAQGAVRRPRPASACSILPVRSVSRAA